MHGKVLLPTSTVLTGVLAPLTGLQLPMNDPQGKENVQEEEANGPTLGASLGTGQALDL